MPEEAPVFVQLASFGDLMNLLPVIREKSLGGATPSLLVGKPYATLLDGVSYCQPIVWEGPVLKPGAALKYAKKVYPGRVIDCVVYNGGDYRYQQRSEDFCREAWRKAGAQRAWGSLPLVFDRRDREREARLLESLHLTGEPLVVLSLLGSAAPFPQAVAEKLKRALFEVSKGIQFVDISTLRAERIYDLLCIFERASALVCSDSGPLHLARAVPSLPILVFNYHVLPGGYDRTAWSSAPWWPQQVFRRGYDKAEESIPELISSLQAVLGGKGSSLVPEIRHVYSAWEAPDEATRRRLTEAKRTWESEYQLGWCWKPIPIPESSLSRDGTSVGDPRRVPFIKDLVAQAVKGARDQDIIFLTNSDVCFVPGLTGRLLEAVRERGSAFTYRWDFRAPLPAVYEESGVEQGTWYLGCDAFAFSVQWWREHGPKFPDMLLGRPSWDTAMRALMKLTGGVNIPRSIYHEEHRSFWYSSGGGEGGPLGGNRHNVVLVYKFFEEFHCGGNDWHTAEDRPKPFRSAIVEVSPQTRQLIGRRANRELQRRLLLLRSPRFSGHLVRYRACHPEIVWPEVRA